MLKKQKVMAAEAETAAPAPPPPQQPQQPQHVAQDAKPTAVRAIVDTSAVRDLEALTEAVAHVDATKLLAIITELRATAGVSTYQPINITFASHIMSAHQATL